MTSFHLNWMHYYWLQPQQTGLCHTANDPVNRGCDQSHRTQFSWNEVTRDEWCECCIVTMSRLKWRHSAAAVLVTNVQSWVVCLGDWRAVKQRSTNAQVCPVVCACCAVGQEVLRSHRYLPLPGHLSAERHWCRAVAVSWPVSWRYRLLPWSWQRFSGCCSVWVLGCICWADPVKSVCKPESRGPLSVVV